MSSLQEARAEGRLKSMFGNLGWLLASNGLMAALSLVYVGIITRTLGIKEFGRFALITGASQALALLVSFETWKIIVQYGLEHDARGDADALARIQKAAMLAELASAALGILCVILLFSIWSEPFNIAGDVKPYAIIYAVIQLITLRSTPTGILRLRDKFDLAAIADSVQPIVRLIGALSVLLFWPTLQGFLMAYAAAELLTALASWILAFRYVDLGRLRRVTLSWQRVLVENVGLLRFMWSTNLQSTLGLASRQAPLLLVGGFGGPTAAGAFRLALQLANALSKASTLLMRAAFPEIVRSIRSVPRERFVRIIGNMLIAGFVAGGIVMLLVVLFGRSLLTLVGGEEFAVGYVMLLWLAGAGCIELTLASFEAVLLVVHRAGSVIAARAIAFAMQVAFMWTLMPIIGASSASVGVFIGSMAAAVFVAISLSRYTKNPNLAWPA